MRLIFTIWITLSLCTYTKLQSQDRFPCTGKQLISLSNGGKTEITYPVFVPFAPPFLTLQYEFDGAFDALGFNTKDSYIYGVEYNTNNIVRLTTSGFQRIGKVTDVNVLKVDAGDCSLDGYYFCYDFEKSRMDLSYLNNLNFFGVLIHPIEEISKPAFLILLLTLMIPKLHMLFNQIMLLTK
jgi:hypothetical protein